jgi:N utilization substance protein B
MATVGKPEVNNARFVKKRKHAREKALQALYQWQISGEDLDWIKQHYLEEQGVSTGDPDYFVELLYQIPAQVEQLDSSYRQFMINEDDRVDPIECNILRIATYEFLHRLEIPYKVVINEAVNLAKSYGAEDSHKFVNAVLDPLSHQIRNLETASSS